MSKDTQHIVIEALADKIIQLENKLEDRAEKNYKKELMAHFMRRYIYEKRLEIVNDFSDFVLDGIQECCDNYAEELKVVANAAYDLLNDISTPFYSSEEEKLSHAHKNVEKLNKLRI